MEERAQCGTVHRQFHIGVIQDDVGRFAAQFQSDFFDRGRRHFHDLPAHFGAPRQSHLVHIGMRAEDLPKRCARPGNHVDHPRRNSRRLCGLGDNERRQRCYRCGLQHDRVSHGYGRGDLPEGHARREIPGDNPYADPEGLAAYKISAGGKSVPGNGDLLFPRELVGGGISELRRICEPTIAPVFRKLDRMTRVHRFGHGKPQTLRRDLIGKIIKLFRSCLWRHPAPLPVIKGPARRRDGRLRVGLTGLRHGCEGLARPWIDVSNVAPLSASTNSPSMNNL